jgi:hypothetical protein
MNKIFYAALLLVGCSYAFTIPNGECQNFTLFNGSANLSDNSTLPYYNETWCAGNATVIYNMTNVTNLTVQGCNSTNATLWANETGTFNNATISCLFNVTPPVVCNNTATYVNVTQNVSVPFCNYSANVTATTSDQWITAVDGLNIHILPIPQSYCYQNINRAAGYLEVFRNDVCNITVTTPATTTACPAAVTCLPYQYNTPCQSCTTCEVCKECAAPRVCAEDDPAPKLLLASLQNETAAQSISISNLTAMLASKDDIIRSQKDALNTLDVTVDKKVEAKTGNVNDMYGYALVAGLCCTVFFVYKSRQPQSTPLAGSGIGAAITKDRLDKLRQQRGGDENGRNTDDAGAVEKSQPGDNQVHIPEV